MQTGNVYLDSNPQGATLCIDAQPLIYPSGEKIRTPVLIIDIPVGYRRFAFHMPGYYRECVTADIIEEQITDIFATMIPK